jgi:hypothetical protein
MRVWSQRYNVRRFSDYRENVLTEDFSQRAAGETRKIDLGNLRETRKINDNKNGLIFVTPQKGQYFCILRIQKFNRSTRKRLETLAHRYHASRPPQQRR